MNGTFKGIYILLSTEIESMTITVLLYDFLTVNETLLLSFL